MVKKSSTGLGAARVCAGLFGPLLVGLGACASGEDPDCTPHEPTVAASFRLAGLPKPGVPGPPFELEAICGVTDVSTSVALACETDTETLALELFTTVDPPAPIPVSAGDRVRLDYRDASPWWSSIHFTLRREDGTLLVGGARSPRPSPDIPDYFSPVPVREAASDCHARPSECAKETPLALTFETNTSTRTLYSGQAADLDGWALRLARALNYTEVICTDFPSRFYSFLIIAQP